MWCKVQCVHGALQSLFSIGVLGVPAALCADSHDRRPPQVLAPDGDDDDDVDEFKIQAFRSMVQDVKTVGIAATSSPAWLDASGPQRKVL